mmetsp:Transcript_140744/g.259091  ORF Transcript_140744/g.259091 Transcript_140744/m.259091 type:complete len:274 (+) Transcript_140744:55-876(+)
MGNVLNSRCGCRCPGEKVVDLDVHSYPASLASVKRNDYDPSNAAARFGGNEHLTSCCCSDTDKAEAVQVQTTQYDIREKSDLDLVSNGGVRQAKAPSESQVPRLALPISGWGHPQEIMHSPGSDDQGRTVQEWAADQEQFAHLPALPEGWIRIRSKTTGAIYYYFKETGETTFTEPVGPPTKNNGLPPGWVEMMSRTTGKVYYWNATLQKSQFQRPTENDGDELPEFSVPQPQEGSEELPLPPGWMEMVSRTTGRVYYFNADMQHSQFERPTA